MSSGTCLVCGGVLGPSPLPGLLRCRACRFSTADVTLQAPALEQLYGESYFTGKEYADYVADRRIIQKNFGRRLATLLPYVSEPQASNVLEIGSAYGFFLELAREHFGHVEGIDISRPAIDYAVHTGLAAVHGDFLLHPVQRPIHVACLWDTIEHVARPDLYLAKLASVMPAGGIVAITTGDIGSLLARLRGRRWRQIHPPTHLHYFTRSTLDALLERHGFRVRYVGYDGVSRSLDMMAYIVLAKNRRWPFGYSLLKNLGLLSRDVYLNLFDIMYVIAEKQS